MSSIPTSSTPSTVHSTPASKRCSNLTGAQPFSTPQRPPGPLAGGSVDREEGGGEGAGSQPCDAQARRSSQRPTAPALSPTSLSALGCSSTPDRYPRSGGDETGDTYMLQKRFSHEGSSSGPSDERYVRSDSQLAVNAATDRDSFAACRVDSFGDTATGGRGNVHGILKKGSLTPGHRSPSLTPHSMSTEHPLPSGGNTPNPSLLDDNPSSSVRFTLPPEPLTDSRRVSRETSRSSASGNVGGGGGLMSRIRGFFGGPKAVRMGSLEEPVTVVGTMPAVPELSPPTAATTATTATITAATAPTASKGQSPMSVMPYPSDPLPSIGAEDTPLSTKTTDSFTEHDAQSSTTPTYVSGPYQHPSFGAVIASFRQDSDVIPFFSSQRAHSSSDDDGAPEAAGYTGGDGNPDTTLRRIDSEAGSPLGSFYQHGNNSFYVPEAPEDIIDIPPNQSFSALGGSFCASPVVFSKKLKKDILAKNLQVLNNNYVVYNDKVIGSGSFGKVKLCFSTEDKCYYAAKILKRRELQRMGIGSQGLDKLLNEVEIMTKLRHENIVALKEVINDEGAAKIYLILELAGYGALINMRSGFTEPDCEGNTRIKESTVTKLAFSMVRALSYAHSQGVAHRDIKPDNVLLTSDWQVKVSDFGVSCLVSKQQTLVREGSIAYLAPEILLPITNDKVVASSPHVSCNLRPSLPADDDEDPWRFYAGLGESVSRVSSGVEPMGALQIEHPDFSMHPGFSAHPPGANDSVLLTPNCKSVDLPTPPQVSMNLSGRTGKVVRVPFQGVAPPASVTPKNNIATSSSPAIPDDNLARFPVFAGPERISSGEGTLSMSNSMRRPRRTDHRINVSLPGSPVFARKRREECSPSFSSLRSPVGAWQIVNRNEVDLFKADVWAVGVSIFAMLHGHLPWLGHIDPPVTHAAALDSDSDMDDENNITKRLDPRSRSRCKRSQRWRRRRSTEDSMDLHNSVYLSPYRLGFQSELSMSDREDQRTTEAAFWTYWETLIRDSELGREVPRGATEKQLFSILCNPDPIQLFHESHEEGCADNDEGWSDGSSSEASSTSAEEEEGDESDCTSTSGSFYKPTATVPPGADSCAELPLDEPLCDGQGSPTARTTSCSPDDRPDTIVPRLHTEDSCDEPVVQFQQKKPSRSTTHNVKRRCKSYRELQQSVFGERFDSCQSCSKHAASFLRLCLQLDPVLRPTMDELLDHPFLAEARKKYDETQLAEAQAAGQAEAAAEAERQPATSAHLHKDPFAEIPVVIEQIADEGDLPETPSRHSLVPPTEERRPERVTRAIRTHEFKSLPNEIPDIFREKGATGAAARRLGFNKLFRRAEDDSALLVLRRQASLIADSSGGFSRQRTDRSPPNACASPNAIALDRKDGNAFSPRSLPGRRSLSVPTRLDEIEVTPSEFSSLAMSPVSSPVRRRTKTIHEGANPPMWLRRESSIDPSASPNSISMRTSDLSKDPSAFSSPKNHSPVKEGATQEKGK